MGRSLRFTFLCDDNERYLIDMLAKALQRSQSDAVRWSVREVAHQLGVYNEAKGIIKKHISQDEEISA